MENSPRASKKIKLAEDGEGLAGVEHGLAECGDMDRQFARVVSTKCGVPIGLWM